MNFNCTKKCELPEAAIIIEVKSSFTKVRDNTGSVGLFSQNWAASVDSFDLLDGILSGLLSRLWKSNIPPDE
ncbi:hypothetical protein WN51_00963 [Melipona quadrifasciata]|uniref:Uncharacterized protein n=1 Tax=Melipona quadrifasciata TaxID=166423 RepID=A0A0N0U4M4_9HYME|nr:hypothetical protein WN51_00963 [Melipona quadrifasciata]